MPDLLTDLSQAATIEAELGVGAGNTTVARLLTAASDAARTFLGRRPLHYQTGVVEKIRAPDRRLLLVNLAPIVGNITSIVDEDGTTIDATSYRVEDADAGFIYREAGWGTPGELLSVTLTGGWVTPAQKASGGWTGPDRSLPSDIEDAVIQAVVARYRRLGQDGGLKSESVGDAAVTYAEPTESGLPLVSEMLLRPYRRLPV